MLLNMRMMSWIEAKCRANNEVLGMSELIIVIYRSRKGEGYMHEGG